MRRTSEKNYLELMRDLAALRRSRAGGILHQELEREISEHEEEVHRRDHHGR
ncbi:hypothetical protein [Nocardia sp. NBC_00403]|uniref:hypothetical protein n=1 Tax=Nocardia sp. NBC_00403 TaxID=2975990 RepID=UPI002E1A3AB7